MVMVGEKVTLHPLLCHLAGKEPFREKVEGCRKHPACKLEITVRIIHLGHHHPHVRIALKITCKYPRHISLPPDIGVHDEVASVRVVDNLTQGDVVPGSESPVFDMDIAYPWVEGAECGELCAGRIVDEIDGHHVGVKQA